MIKLWLAYGRALKLEIGLELIEIIDLSLVRKHSNCLASVSRSIDL